jgi:hydroxymethylpyrimidine pyrophosphatase-like HAD family hydrolase
MGNAAPDVRRAADRTVADMDHGGCAEAIRLWLRESVN